MEKIKEIFKHFLISEIIISICFIFYVLINIMYDGVDSLTTVIYLFNYLLISLVNFILSIIFYFLNRILPKTESILLIFIVFVFTIIFYNYEPSNKYVNVYYKDIPESNYGFYKILIIIISILIIIHLSVKFIPSIGLRKK